MGMFDFVTNKIEGALGSVADVADGLPLGAFGAALGSTAHAGRAAMDIIQGDDGSALHETMQTISIAAGALPYGKETQPLLEQGTDALMPHVDEDTHHDVSTLGQVGGSLGTLVGLAEAPLLGGPMALISGASHGREAGDAASSIFGGLFD